MDLELETFFFQQWYPARDLMAASIAERLVHKRMVNMLQTTVATYIVITRVESKQELAERLEATE